MSPCGSVSANSSALPSITVCVPVYNVELYLRECLDSIIEQDYSRFDIVLVDDGSSDDSGAICDQYAGKYSDRVRVVHKVNEGPLLARRDAVALATGDYVMCVDSDDMLMPGALSAVAEAIGATGADVVKFGLTRDKDVLPEQSAASHADAHCTSDEKTEKLRALCRSTAGAENSMCSKAVRRACVGADVDFSEFGGVKFAEDFLQTVVVYDRAETFCSVDVPLYYYRPGTGVTRAYNPRFYSDVCRCLTFAENYAAQWEREYKCDGLLAGLAACRLDSASQYAEWMASRGDTAGLDALSSSADFIRCVATAGSNELLRFDRRLVIGALKKGLYPLVAAVAKARVFKAGLHLTN